MQRTGYYLSLVLPSLVWILSALAIIGWIVHSPVLVCSFPSTRGMSFDTAICLILLSTNSLLIHFQESRYFSYVLSGAVLFISCFAFLENIFNLDIGLDRIFFKTMDMTDDLFPKKISSNALMCFILLGLSLITNTLKKFKAQYWTSSYLTTLAFSFTFVAIISFFLGYSGDWYDERAILTNTCILLSALSIYFFLMSRNDDYRNWYHLHLGILFFAIAFKLWGFLTSREFVPLVGEGDHQFLINYIYGLIILLSMLGGMIFFNKAAVSMEDIVEAKAAFELNSQVKERLLRYISHEIRNPLAAITGYIEPLSQMPVPEEIKEVAKGTLSASRHLKNIVEDLLATSRYESGKLELQMEETLFLSWIEDLSGLLKSQCDRKEIEFEMIISEKRPGLVVLDMNKVSQVIINFVSNAIKHTPSKGKVTLNIEFSIDQNKGRIMHVSVKDTGEGVPLDQQEKLFQPFSQARDEDKKVGMGIGLTVCKTFVEMMKGTIGFTSEPQKGSTFYFSINW